MSLYEDATVTSDSLSPQGNTGLHFLYQFGYADIADYFVSKGADPTICNNKNFPCTSGFKGDVGGGAAASTG